MTDPNLVILAGGLSSRMKNSVADENIDPQVLRDTRSKSKTMIGIGGDKRPFLDYLLFNAREAGYRDVVIVIGEHDEAVREYYGQKLTGNPFHGLTISYAVQPIPVNRSKPLGTADALSHALNAKTEWKGKQFTVCNSDNLYSRDALRLLLASDYPNTMIDYDRHALKFPPEKIQQFSVISKDDEGFLLDIIEKPSAKEIEQVKRNNGTIGVSMNIFRLRYEDIFPFLEQVQLHPIRNEKELPVAVSMMVHKNPGSMFAYSLSEHVPDLTSKEDIVFVKKYLEQEFNNFSF
jgi:glucose-1-phosphate adenylyltransferase